MADKLELEYNSTHGDYRADYKGLRVRAVVDPDAQNPFEDTDGHFPMLVRLPDRHSRIETKYGVELTDVITQFNDELLVHLQVNIAIWEDEGAFDEICVKTIRCHDHDRLMARVREMSKLGIFAREYGPVA